MYFYIIYESPISVIVVLQCCHIFQKIQKSRKSTKTIQQSAATFVLWKKMPTVTTCTCIIDLLIEKYELGFLLTITELINGEFVKSNATLIHPSLVFFDTTLKRAKEYGMYNVTYLHFIHFPWLLWFDILVWWSSKIYIYLPICHSVYKYAQLCTDQGFGHIPVN